MLLQIAGMALFICVAAGAIANRWGVAVSLLFVVLALWSNQLMKFAEPLLDTSWATIFGMTALYALLQYADNARRKWLIFAGIALGLSVLIRANFLPFVGVAVLWIWLEEPPRSSRKKAVDAFLLLVLVVSLLSVIGMRNQLVAGEWRWLPTNGLPNLWVGNHPPEFDGPTYFVLKWVPEEREILQHVTNYISSEPLAMAQRILGKTAYILGIEKQSLYNFSADVKTGYQVNYKILVPWLLAVIGSISLWIRPGPIRRTELLLLWAWIGIVNVPLATLFFPWGYGWRLSGPSFPVLYLIGAIALFQWYAGARTSWSEGYAAQRQVPESP
jgi:hypothetical protein